MDKLKSAVEGSARKIEACRAGAASPAPVARQADYPQPPALPPEDQALALATTACTKRSFSTAGGESTKG